MRILENRIRRYVAQRAGANPAVRHRARCGLTARMFLQGGTSMTVAHILAEKGSSVVTVQPDRTLDDAIHLLAKKSVGALVVTDGGRTMVGIISERDIMRALAHQGAAALDAPISSHMTREVTACQRETTSEEIMRLMTDGRFRHMPVCEKGRLVGIVSIGDVIKRRLVTMEAEHRAMRDYITMT
jgi:CBS domain-containing protein